MARLVLVAALLAAPLAGCLGGPMDGPDLASMGAALTVHTEQGACLIPTSTAEEAGLLAAASDAIAGIYTTHRRAFLPGQIDAILEESRYVQVHFPPNTSIELPSYPEANETTFEDLYLVWYTRADVGNVLSNGGSYATTYPMNELEQRARTAVATACPEDPDQGPEGTYRLAWVQGDEQVDPPSSGACDVRFDHRVLEAERSIEYLGETYDFDAANLSRMTAFDVWAQPADCPVAYRLAPDASVLSAELGGYGTLNLSFEANNTLNVDARQWLASGENVTFAYNTSTQAEGQRSWRNGTITVAYMDTWPRSGLRGTDG